MQSIFLHYITELGAFSYLLVFVGMVLEGEVVIFASFYLAHQGYLNLPIVVLFAISGIIIGDVLWYKIGEHLHKSSPLFKKVSEKIGKPFDRQLHRRPIFTLFIAKFTYGIYRTTLMRAGAIKVPFKPFFRVIFVSAIMWLLLMAGLAYFSSASFHLFRHYLKYGEVGLLIGLLLFALLAKLFSKFAKREIEESDKKDEEIQ